MEKPALFVIVTLVGLISCGFIMVLVMTDSQEDIYELRTEIIVFENIIFSGISGEPNNGFILQLSNPNSVMDVVLEWGNVTGYGVNKVFFINPEHSFFASNSEGQVTLYGVGWTEGYEYRIELISINGSKFITKVTID